MAVRADARAPVAPRAIGTCCAGALGSIGGPAPILAQSSIKKVELVDFEDLGMEAMRKIEVVDFPAFIVVDEHGERLF